MEQPMMVSTYRKESPQLWRRDRILDLISETRACKRYHLWAAYWLMLEETAGLLHAMGGMAGTW
jgi:hypothetical protein